MVPPACVIKIIFAVYHHMLSLYSTIITRIIINKNEGRCRDVKTQKACEQGWEVNVGPKIKQTTSLHITLHKYLHRYKAKYKELFLCRVIWKWFV